MYLPLQHAQELMPPDFVLVRGVQYASYVRTYLRVDDSIHRRKLDIRWRLPRAVDLDYSSTMLGLPSTYGSCVAPPRKALNGPSLLDRWFVGHKYGVETPSAWRRKGLVLQTRDSQLQESPSHSIARPDTKPMLEDHAEERERERESEGDRKQYRALYPVLLCLALYTLDLKTFCSHTVVSTAASRTTSDLCPQSKFFLLLGSTEHMHCTHFSSINSYIHPPSILSSGHSNLEQVERVAQAMRVIT